VFGFQLILPSNLRLRLSLSLLLTVALVILFVDLSFFRSIVLIVFFRRNCFIFRISNFGNFKVRQSCFLIVIIHLVVFLQVLLACQVHHHVHYTWGVILVLVECKVHRSLHKLLLNYNDQVPLSFLVQI
jgi:hypothetical protein